MKLKTILSTLFLIAVGVQSYADNVLTASDVSIQAGQTATLNITLSDEGPSYNAFVFDLLLPEGISIATSAEDGQYIATYNSERAKGSDYQLLIANHKAHSYRVLGFNQTNESFGSKKARDIRRHRLSYLFQNYGLVDNETCKFNLNLALEFSDLDREQKKKAISDALTSVGLEGFDNRKVFSLSGGEQQRVALAKIILKSPDLILADEPTGSLDADNRDYVLSILKKLNDEGKTIIMVTHDVKVDSCAKRHICL